MRAILCALLAACAGTTVSPPHLEKFPYPATRRTDAADTLHGVRVADPYRWLEEEKSPEVQAWMKAEDDLARDHLRRIPGRDAFAARLAQVLYVDSIGLPTLRGSRSFYSRRFAAKEKAIYYLRDGGQERALLDPNVWSKDGSVALGGTWPSWNGKLVAFNEKPNNSDEATLHVIDVDSGQRLPDAIEGTKYAGASWTPSGDGFYYTWIPTDPKISVADRPGYQTIKFHKLGDDPSRDAVIVEKIGDPRLFQHADLSKDGHWLLRVVSHGWRSTDVYFRDQRKPGSSWVTLTAGQDAIYDVDVYGDRFYVRTNEGAPNGRVFAVDPARPERSTWAEIIPERKDAPLQDKSVVGGALALVYLKDVVTHVELHALDGKLLREVAMPAIGTSSNLVGDEDGDEAYFSFESFTFPREIWRTSVKNGGAELHFRLSVPVDPTPFAVEQVFFQSKDGTRVPMFIIRRKDQKLDGATPTILTGYGGFLVANKPFFAASIYPWLEHGGIYAVANLRGGSEYGEEWHRAGMLGNKQHVFDDFIAAAEFLVRSGYTSPARLAIRGGSNGGLLVGAAEMQRPDLFGVVLCHVPLLDMVRYHLFGSGKTWISEYGSADDSAQFKWLNAYSPYQQVANGTRYPPTLVLSADADDRVDPMHARKFAAALQAASSGGPVLLRIERHSGHGGADLIKATVEKTADEYAFALEQMGLVPAPVATR
jgi:prolyl oligopeptidase